MRRREFIRLVGGIVVTWPAVAIAQQDSKKRLVGLMASFTDKEMTPLVAAFRARDARVGVDRGSKYCFRC
jgi:hypothetical protein